MPATHEARVAITAEADLVPARAQARSLALELGFSRTDATLIATAVSEIARNIVVHARDGEIVMSARLEPERYGLVVRATDAGPGISRIDDVLGGSASPRGGLGLGVAGARRLMDEFDIESDPAHGTVVTMTKWRSRDELERLREQRRSRNGDGP